MADPQVWYNNDDGGGMKMFKAYQNYWKNSFKYQATSTRADYWWPVLMNLIIYAILALLLMASGISSVGSLLQGTTDGMGTVMILMVVMLIFSIATIFPSIAICVRRVRDAGLSVWFVLGIWLLSIILGNVDNEFCTGLMGVIEIIFLVVTCLPSGYINKHGWWSPNTSNDVTIPTLRNN